MQNTRWKSQSTLHIMKVHNNQCSTPMNYEYASQQYLLQLNKDVLHTLMACDVNEILKFITNQSQTLKIDQKLDDIISESKLYLNLQKILPQIFPKELSSYQQTQIWRRLIVLSHFAFIFEPYSMEKRYIDVVESIILKVYEVTQDIQDVICLQRLLVGILSVQEALRVICYLRSTSLRNSNSVQFGSSSLVSQFTLDALHIKDAKLVISKEQIRKLKECINLQQCDVTMKTQSQFADIKVTFSQISEVLTSEKFIEKPHLQQLTDGAIIYDCVTQQNALILFDLNDEFEAIHYYIPQKLCNQQQIIQQIVLCSNIQNITIPKKLQFWDIQPNFILISGAFNNCYCRTEPKQLLREQVEQSIKAIKNSNMCIMIECDIHLVVDKKCGIEYQTYYKHQDGPIMIRETLIHVPIPVITINRNDDTNEFVKRIILNYESINTIDNFIDELKSLFYQYQIDGVMLTGFTDISLQAIQYLDIQLLINFPNKMFITTDKIQTSLRHIQHQFESNLLVYRNKLQDILIYNKLKDFRAILNLVQVKSTIDYLSLSNQTKNRHIQNLNYKVEKISNNLPFQSSDNSFEVQMYQLLSNGYQISINENVYVMSTSQSSQTSTVIIINLGETTDLRPFSIPSFNDDDVCIARPVKFCFLEQRSSNIIVIDCSNLSETLPPHINGHPMFASEMHEAVVTSILHSVQIYEVSYVCSLSKQTNVLQSYQGLVQNDQQAALSASAVRCLKMLVRHQTAPVNDLVTILRRSASLVYLLVFDAISSTALLRPTAFSTGVFKPVQLTLAQLKLVLPYFTLQYIIHLPLTETTLFGLPFSRLQDSSRKAISLLFPTFTAPLTLSVGQNQFQTATVDSVFEGRVQFQSVVIVSRATERTASFASLLTEQGPVLFVAPRYETIAGVELVPGLLGQPSYIHKNIATSAGEFGVHYSAVGQLYCVYLHSFQFFYDPNQLANEFQLKLPFTQMMGESTLEDGAELLLDRTAAVVALTKQLLQKLVAPPSMIIGVGGVGVLGSASLQQFYKNYALTTQIRSSVPVLFRQPVFTVWIPLNVRSVFETKNDLRGYKVSDHKMVERLLVELQIVQNKIVDEFRGGAVIPMRTALVCHENVITGFEIQEAVRGSPWLNWTGTELLIIEEGIRGVIQVFQCIKALQ